MNPIIYGAARAGEFDVLLKYRDQFEVQVTPNNNTVLHIAALFNKTQCVNEISTNCPQLLRKVNNKGETALHIAAKEGCNEVVKTLIECSKTLDRDLESGAVVDKEMLRMTNKDGDTALHEAVRVGHVGVVKMLIEEDPDFPHSCNKSDETPLYLAIEQGLEDCVSEILRICSSPSTVGPGGRSALHAAVIVGSPEIFLELLKWEPSLSRKPDHLKGWTPLHYAAYLGHQEYATKLIESDRSLVYLIADKDHNNTALHVAASRGNIDIMKVLFSTCPDCIEMVNIKGQNIIHIAVASKKEKEISYFLDHTAGPNVTGSLIYQKDNNGNTPLHLLAASNRCPSELEFLWRFLFTSRQEKMYFNNESMTPMDIFTENMQSLKVDSEIMERIRRDGPIRLRKLTSRDTDNAAASANNIQAQVVEDVDNNSEVLKDVESSGSTDTNLIVATLIATVTFAAGFTLPGGYNGNDGPNHGMAILTRKRAFQAFVIADTIAMMSSSCAVFIYFVIASISASSSLAHLLLYIVKNLLIVAQGTMMIAFVTGLYAMLEPSPTLRVSACVIGSLFLLVYYLLAGLTDPYIVRIVSKKIQRSGVTITGRSNAYILEKMFTRCLGHSS